MAATEPQTGVASTAAALGIDLFSWQPRSIKYWQSKVCPYDQEVIETVQGLLEASGDEETQLTQGTSWQEHHTERCTVQDYCADEIFEALSLEQQRGIILWILTTCSEISTLAREAKCSAEVLAALGKQRRFAAYCLSAHALQVRFRRSPVPQKLQAVVQEAFGPSITGFKGKRGRH